MNKIALTCIVAGCSAIVAKGSPSDDVKAAAQSLANAANYTWTTTTANNGGDGGGGGRGGFGGPVTGMTQKDGLTITTREFNGNKMQTVKMGDKTVRQNQDGAWMTNEELMAQNGGGGGGGGRRGRGGFGAMAVVLPADQVGTLIAGVNGDLKTDDSGAIVGDLTPAAVTPLLSFGGRGRRGGGGGGGGGGGDQPPAPPPAPTNASGTVKFWIKDGVLAKYEIHVKGTVQGRNGDMDVDRTTTTAIQDVGTSKLDVPADAMAKLKA